MSGLPEKPSSFSTSSSTGRPWVSQPPRAPTTYCPACAGSAGRCPWRAGLDVVHPRAAVGRGRALEEDEGPLAVAAGRGPAGRSGLLPPAPDRFLEGPERRPWDRPRQTPSCPSLPAASRPQYPLPRPAVGCVRDQRPHPPVGDEVVIPRGTTPLGPLVTPAARVATGERRKPAHPGAATPGPGITGGQSGLVLLAGALAGPAGLARRGHP